MKVKPLGKGSFGAALLIRRKSDGQLLVVKEVNMAKMNSKEREEARNECRILQQLSHPNIVRYYEHLERNGVLYIIMEYADGGDLHSKMKRHPAGLPEDVCLHYFAQICLAMDYLHSRHILHRDIKTMNVFLTSSGAVKLGDFGIATVLRNTMGMANTVCGTPYYFSPELCKNKPYNNRSDVWAMGVVLYELATGKHAFDGNSMQQLMQRILKTNAPPLPTTFSRDFRAMLDNCLQKDPLRRPNMKQLLTLEPVRSALVKLEQALMLATQCKVRLQDIVGSGSGNQGEGGLKMLDSPRISALPPPAAAVTAAPSNAAAFKKSPQQLLADALAAPTGFQLPKPVIALHRENPNQMPSAARKPSVSPPRPAEAPSPAQNQQVPQRSPGASPQLPSQAQAGAKASGAISPKLGHVNAFINELDRPLEEHARDAIRAFMKRKEEEAAEARRKEALAQKELEDKKAEMLRVMAEHQQKMREAARLRQQKAIEQQQQQMQFLEQQRQQQQQYHHQHSAQKSPQQQGLVFGADPRPVKKAPVLGEVAPPHHQDATPHRKKLRKVIAANSPRHTPPAVTKFLPPNVHQHAAGQLPQLPQPHARGVKEGGSGGDNAQRPRSDSPQPVPPVDVARASHWVEKQNQERRNKKLDEDRRAVRQLDDIVTRVVDPELDAWVRRQQNARRLASEPAQLDTPAPPPAIMRAGSDEVPAGVEARRAASESALQHHIAKANGKNSTDQQQSYQWVKAQQQPETARSHQSSGNIGISNVVTPCSISGGYETARAPPKDGGSGSNLRQSTTAAVDVERKIPRMDSSMRDRYMQELDQSPPNGLATQHYRQLPIVASAGVETRRLPLEPDEDNAGALKPISVRGVEAMDDIESIVHEEDSAGVDPEMDAAERARLLQLQQGVAKSTYADMLSHLKHVLDQKGRKTGGMSSRHQTAIDVATAAATPQTKVMPESDDVTPSAHTSVAATTPQGAPGAPPSVQSRRMQQQQLIAPLEEIVCTEDFITPQSSKSKRPAIDDDDDDEDRGEDDSSETSSVEEDFADEVPITPFRKDGEGKRFRKSSALSPQNPELALEEEGKASDEESEHEEEEEDIDEEALYSNEQLIQEPCEEEEQFAHYLAQYCGDHFIGTTPVTLDGEPLFQAAKNSNAVAVGVGRQQQPVSSKPVTVRLREYIVGKIGRTATERAILSLLSLKSTSSSPTSQSSSPVHHIKNLIMNALAQRGGRKANTTSDAAAGLQREADEVFSLCAQLLFLEEEEA